MTEFNNLANGGGEFMSVKTTRRQFTATALGAALLPGVVTKASAETTLERLRREGVVTIGYTSEVPWMYLDDNGRLTGIAIEEARYLFKQIGIPELKGVDTEWASLIPSLQTARIDGITAGMAILPKRCKAINFADPTLAMGSAIVVKEGNPFNIHSYQDAADNTDIRVGVIPGGQETTYFRVHGVSDDRMTKFTLPNDLFQALIAGRIDTFALTSITVQEKIKQLGSDGGIERAAPMEDVYIDGKLQKFYTGAGFRKEDTDLHEAYTAAVRAFVGTPEHMAIVEPFGISSAEAPPNPPKTSAELCAEEATP